MKAPKLLQLLSLIGCLLAVPSVTRAGSNLDVAHQLNEAFVEVAGRVSPSVVVITVVEKPVVWPAGPPEATDSPRDFWRNFHRQFEDSTPEKSRGQGSGVIVRKNGYIVTNRHVVDDAEQIEVRLLDGRTFKATVRGVDPGSDIAVIKIDADNLPTATFGDSSKARVGEFAIAIGAPFTYDFSVTFGHVSAKSRSNVIPMFEGGGAMDQDFIQTDANINPGNSGGPLLNLDGEVIGINTLIRGFQTGIGFAIPSNLAREVSDKLIADGKFVRPWLGIGISSLKDEDSLQELVKNLTGGVVVKSIFTNGPSAKADLRLSDVIVKVDDKAVGTVQQLRDEVRKKAIGQSVTLEVFRAGKTVQIKVRPAEFVDPSITVVRSNTEPGESAPSGLGLTVHALTRELAGQFGVDLTEGVVVVSVDRKSAAGRKGIKPGDIITSIAQQPVASLKQFRDALQKADLKKGVPINLTSGGTARYEILKDDNE